MSRKGLVCTSELIYSYDELTGQSFKVSESMLQLNFMRLVKISTIVLSVMVFANLVTTAHAQVAQVIGASSDGEQTVSDVSLLDSPAAVSELVSRLSDNEVRDLLLQQLDAVASDRAAAQTVKGDSIFTLVTTNVPKSIDRAFRTLPDLISDRQLSLTMFADTLGENGLWKLLRGLVFAILLGIAFELLVRHFTAKYRSGLDEPSANFALKKILRLLSLRLLLDLSGLIAFMLVAQMSIPFFIEEPGQYVAHHILWNLVLIPRLFSVICKFVFAPKRPDLRLMHTTDASARFLHTHLVGVVILIGLTLSMVDVHAASGAPHGTNMGFWFNLIIHIYFGFIAWHSRSIFTDMLDGPGNDSSVLERRVARWYPYYAISVVIGSWLLVEVLVIQGQVALVAKGVQYSTMLILLLAPFLDTTIRALVRHLTAPAEGDGEIAFRAHRSTMRCYVRMSRVITLMIVLFLIARIWNLDLATMNASNLGAGTIRKLLNFIGINAVGYLVWEIATLILNKKLAREKTAGSPGETALPGGDGGGVGGSRLSTVLPLVLWFTQACIIVMTLLVSLGNVGIDTTPLLAGAGIVGLAIGFGAQKLVGDIVSGLFFLIDDAFRTGEYVNVEGTMGTIEKISLRAMQLRHHRGAIHTIPYGEIPKITNFSRDWTIMKLTFTVPFETDLIKVKRIFKTIGTELMEIPEFADDFISPFKSAGVIQVDDVGIVVRGKFMVKPGKQFSIRKEIFNRIKSEFAKNGIQFARKEVRVKLDGDASKELTESEVNAIGGAALEASTSKPDVS